MFKVYLHTTLTENEQYLFDNLKDHATLAHGSENNENKLRKSNIFFKLANLNNC